MSKYEQKYEYKKRQSYGLCDTRWPFFSVAELQKKTQIIKTAQKTQTHIHRKFEVKLF